MPHDLRDLSSPTRDQTQALSDKSVDRVLTIELSGNSLIYIRFWVLELWEFLFSILHYHFSERFCVHWKRVYSLFEKIYLFWSNSVFLIFSYLFWIFILIYFSCYQNTVSVFGPSKSELGRLFYTLKCPEWNDFVLVHTLEWSLLDIEFWFWIAFP